jgi:peroxiredoxin
MKRIGMLVILGSLLISGVLAYAGNDFPSVNLRNLMNPGGSAINLSPFDDDIVIVDFWKARCPSCQASIRRIRTLHNELNSQGLEAISICRLSSNAEAQQAQNEANRISDLNYPIAYGGTTDVNRLLLYFLQKYVPNKPRRQGMPQIFVLDGSGNCLGYWYGEPPEGELERVVREAVR